MESGPVSPLVFMITPGILIIIGIAIWLVKSYTKNKSNNTVENRKAIIGTFLFIVSGIPLLIYPGALICNAMMFDSPAMTSADKFLASTWCVLTLFYPATYIVALIFYKQRKKLLYASAPLIHVVIAILLFSILGAVQKG